eukprot:193456-Amphidinium_carterae.2
MQSSTWYSVNDSGHADGVHEDPEDADPYLHDDGSEQSWVEAQRARLREHLQRSRVAKTHEQDGRQQGNTAIRAAEIPLSALQRGSNRAIRSTASALPTTGSSRTHRMQQLLQRRGQATDASTASSSSLAR